MQWMTFKKIMTVFNKMNNYYLLFFLYVIQTIEITDLNRMLKVNSIIRLRKKKECSKVYPFTKRFRVVEAFCSTSYHFFINSR